MARSRRLLAGFFTFAGTLHFVIPRSYESIVPPCLPLRREAVVISGVAEIAGGVAVLPPRQPPLRPLVAPRPAGRRLPGQRPHGGQPRAGPGLDLRRIPRWALWARLPLQPLAMLWVWRATANDRREKCFVCRAFVSGIEDRLHGAARALCRQPAPGTPETGHLPGGAGFRCELHRTEISLLERGGREPRLGTIVKLAAPSTRRPPSSVPAIRWLDAAQISFKIEAALGPGSAQGRNCCSRPPAGPRKLWTLSSSERASWISLIAWPIGMFLDGRAQRRGDQMGSGRLLFRHRRWRAPGRRGSLRPASRRRSRSGGRRLPRDCGVASARASASRVTPSLQAAPSSAERENCSAIAWMPSGLPQGRGLQGFWVFSGT